LLQKLCKLKLVSQSNLFVNVYIAAYVFTRFNSQCAAMTNNISKILIYMMMHAVRFALCDVYDPPDIASPTAEFCTRKIIVTNAHAGNRMLTELTVNCMIHAAGSDAGIMV
jgi:hypothetical protein